MKVEIDHDISMIANFKKIFDLTYLKNTDEGESRCLVVTAEDSQLTLDGVSKARYFIGKRNKGSQMRAHQKNIWKENTDKEVTRTK